MKTFRRLVVVVLAAMIMIPIFNACKKGAEDPSLSFYSRKHRLCQDWGFSFYKRVEQTNSNSTSYEFDGASFVTMYANYHYIAHATMKISFSKNGTYLWDQYVSTDTSTCSYKEEGSWYFSGGSKDSDTKSKELLGLQPTKETTILQINGSTSTTNWVGTGDLMARVYKIVKLSSDEVKLTMKDETTYILSSPNTSDLSIISEDIDLKKSL